MRKLVKKIAPIAISTLAITLVSCGNSTNSNSTELNPIESDLSSIEERNVSEITLKKEFDLDGFEELSNEERDSFINNYSFKTSNDIKNEYKSMKRTVNYTYDPFLSYKVDYQIFKEIIIDFETGNLSYYENYFEQEKEKGSIYIETSKTSDGYMVAYSYEIKNEISYKPEESLSIKSIQGKTKGYTILPYNEEYMNSFINNMINESLYDCEFLEGSPDMDTYKKDNDSFSSGFASLYGYVVNNGIVTKKNDADRSKMLDWYYTSENALEKYSKLTRQLDMNQEYKRVEGIELNLDDLSFYNANFSLVHYFAKHMIEDNSFPKEITDDFKITIYR